MYNPTMFAYGIDHTGARALMRHLGLRPYAIFPGPDWDTLAVYVHPPGQPACILIQHAWSYEWLEDWISGPTRPVEDASTKVIRLRQEAQALAERLGCPVAGTLLICGSIRGIHRLQPLLETARQRDVTVVFPYSSQWPTHLTWIQPPVQVTQPALPPYPSRTRWTASIEPAWWLNRLSSLGDVSDQERKAQARSLAEQGLIYLKEAPARLLLEGPTVLAAARETLIALADHLDRPVGRRYLFWVGFYLANASLAGASEDPNLEATVVGFLTHLLSRFEQWSTRERRVVLRGLEMLAQQTADFAFSPDTPLGQLLAGLLPRLLHSDFLDQAGDGWPFKWRLEELALTLARCGCVPAVTWLRQWRQHNLRGDTLAKAYRGLIDRLVREPSRDLWRAVAWAGLDQELRHAFEWHLYADDFAPAFWDLAGQEDALLKALVEAALASLRDPHLRPSPETLQRLTETVQRRLQAPPVPTWVRSQLESALAKLPRL